MVTILSTANEMQETLATRFAELYTRFYEGNLGDGEPWSVTVKGARNNSFYLAYENVQDEEAFMPSRLGLNDFSEWVDELAEQTGEVVTDEEAEAILNPPDNGDDHDSTPLALRNAIAELIRNISQEKEGEIGKNGARLNKGASLNRIATIGERLLESGSEILGGLTPIQYAVMRVQEAYEDLGEYDVNLGDNEVSTTRTVYREICEPRDGIRTQFSDVYARTPNGTPSVNDAGLPHTRVVTTIALNKLASVAKIVNLPGINFDKVMSAAKNFPEKALAAFMRMLVNDDTPVGEIVQHLDTIMGSDERDVEAYAHDYLGIEVDDEVRSVAWEKEEYDLEVRPVKELLGVVLGFLGLLEADGKIPLNRFIATTFRHAFNPEDYGAEGVLSMLLNSSWITEKQAGIFRKMWEAADEVVEHPAVEHPAVEHTAVAAPVEVVEDDDDEELPF